MSNYISLFKNNKFDELKKLINNNYNYAFYCACGNGHIDMAKWLLSIPNNNININADNDFAFCFTCANGHIEVAKWLLDIPNNNININAENDDAFRDACTYGHIEIAKWLLLIPNNNININVDDDYVFRCACFYNRVEIAKWLCTLDKRYRIIIENNKIVSYKIINIIDQIYENINNVEKLQKIVTCSTLSESTQCPVCMNDYQNNMVSFCGFHYYCIECFKKSNKEQCLMHCKNIDPIVYL